MIHTDILSFKGAKYLWFSLALIVFCCILYVTQYGATQPPNGGTWQGYTLGGIGGLLIVWLAFLGWRKRSYASNMGSVAGWTSAHVYLGTAVLIVATLHSAGQLGWNVHTLSYIFTVVVILSGFFGIALYLMLPTKGATLRGGLSREQLFIELQDLSEQAQTAAGKCSVDVERVVESALKGTRIGGGLFAQLSSSDRSQMVAIADGREKKVSNKDQNRVLSFLADRLPNATRQSEIIPLRELLALMSRRQVVIRRIVGDIRLHALMRLWLYIHVPVTAALIVTLLIHILVTFLYW